MSKYGELVEQAMAQAPRHFTLDPQSRPNRASCALGVTLPRLSADFGDRFSMHHDRHEYPLEKL